MPSKYPIEVEVTILPPLNNTAGRDRIRLNVGENPTLKGVVDRLLDHFGSQAFRLHFFDTKNRFIPAWRAFINDGPVVRLATAQGQSTPVHNHDKITLLLALAGG